MGRLWGCLVVWCLVCVCVRVCWMNVVVSSLSSMVDIMIGFVLFLLNRYIMLNVSVLMVVDVGSVSIYVIMMFLVMF